MRHDLGGGHHYFWFALLPEGFHQLVCSLIAQRQQAKEPNIH